MRDPRIARTWVDRVTYRARTQEARPPPDGSDPRPATSPRSKASCDPAMPETKFNRSTSRFLARLRDLSPRHTVLLFTPVVVPLSPIESKWPTDQDPFELLGRALGEYHRRIRHVPYVPSVGFTDTHGVFLTKADAVIVVTCAPSIDGKADLLKQADFAQSVVDYLDNDDEESSDPLLVLVQFGDSALPIDIRAYEDVLQSDLYSRQTARKAAQLLYETEP